jgi:hypothetical protein
MKREDMGYRNKELNTGEGLREFLDDAKGKSWYES